MDTYPYYIIRNTVCQYGGFQKCVEKIDAEIKTMYNEKKAARYGVRTVYI